MIKRIIICVLCLILSVSVCAFAEELADVNPEQAPLEQLPENNSRGPEGEQRPMGDMGGDMPGEMPQVDGYQPREGSDMPGGVPPMEGHQPPEWGDMQGRRGQGGFLGMEQAAPAETQTDTPITFKGVIKEYFTPILSVILLAFAFIFVIFYKRKTY